LPQTRQHNDQATDKSLDGYRAHKHLGRDIYGPLFLANRQLARHLPRCCSVSVSTGRVYWPIKISNRREAKMARFDDLIAVVTGAGSGLGYATAQRLAEEGATVALLDLNLDTATTAAKKINSGQKSARAYSVDVGKWESVDQTVAKVISDLGQPDILVNCAGIGKFVRSELETQENWEHIIGVNLTGTFLMCRSVLPGMIEKESGSIVNIASNAGLMGQPYSAAYCASKGGVVNLTRALAVEYRSRGVRVNAVAPGGMNTPMIDTWGFPEGASGKDFARIMSPLGNSEPAEIAALVAFIASSDGRYMVGQIVGMDGGITCG